MRLALFFVFLFSLTFVLAAPIETFDGDTSFADQDPNITFIINLSVENTGVNNSSHVNNLQITFSDNFTLTSDTNGTTSSIKRFSSTSTTLTWTGANLVLNNSKEYFWFTFTTPTYVNTYDFSVVASNTSGTYASDTLTLSINDIAAPKVTIESPEEKTYNEEFILVNISLNEQGTCYYSLDQGASNRTLNSDGDIYFSKNVSFDDGKEELWAYCQDNAGNWNLTEKVGFILDYEENTPTETETEIINETTNETNETTSEEEESTQPEEKINEETVSPSTDENSQASNASKGVGGNVIAIVIFTIIGIAIIFLLFRLFTSQ